MSRFSETMRWLGYFMAAGVLAVGLTACGGGDDGDDGAPGAAGPPGAPGTSVTSSAESLEFTFDSVTISSPPVVDFSVQNEAGIPFAAIDAGDLSFTIAKLVPPSGGNSSHWQSYINTTESATAGPAAPASSVQATRESNGTLVNHGDGSYTYTFATDVANVTTPVAVPYEPDLTHRIAIQLGGGLPVSNPIYTFRPSDNATTGLDTRQIVKTETCNTCHDQLALHGGGRVEVEYCVTCHNPGTTDANTANTVDFKVMVHKIHMGEDLPSVAAGGSYQIYGFRNSIHDYSDVVLPQDIRNCTTCHDGSDPETPDADNWTTTVNMQACGSCHDTVDFSIDGSVDPAGHSGGIVTDNTECITCHAAGRVAGSVEAAHVIPVQVARAAFQYNILEICGVAVGSDPVCAPGAAPVVTFSVTDPTNGDAPYDVNGTTGDPQFTGSGASLNVLIAWDTDDYNNIDGSSPPARADSVNARTTAVDNGDGTFTVTSPDLIPVTATGSGAIGMEGHPAGDFDGDTVFSDRIPVKSEVAYFRITDATTMARRQVVDNALCNDCHEQVNFHGNGRNGEVAICVMCHNPNNTDVARRPKDGAGAVDVAATVDGKREEAIDFRTLIHGIHAAAETAFDGSSAHGFREQGLVVYGFGGTAHDYSHVRFPGSLQNCEGCHAAGTYNLDGIWDLPTQNGLLSTTTVAAPTATDAATLTAELADPTDDLNTTPTAAVCGSCHDSDLARAHMIVPGGAQFEQTQGVISATAVETCATCHGPGRSADVATVHTP
ncbi:MAG: OmcA/MtrC family decaheme c-type cytochrome [Thiogranum sp.]|nr:OmcA/MtrC family decaheme c-type cytochrome [Thiogranum sp.]